MRKPKNSIFSELYFDQYEVSVTAKNIRYFEVEEHPLVKVNANVFTNTSARSEDWLYSISMLISFK